METTSGKNERFIEYVIKRCLKDKGWAARLRRIDNPATEHQSWELLAYFNIDLESERRRLPFVTVAAAIAKAGVQCNGNLGLGRAIAACYSDGRDNDQARMRLRRLLACDDLAELCRILRPLFSLIDSRLGLPLDYLRLLRQLRGFSFDDQKVKAQWALEFYGRQSLNFAEEKKWL